jgi:hypothetical protein
MGRPGAGEVAEEAHGSDQTLASAAEAALILGRVCGTAESRALKQTFFRQRLEANAPAGVELCST